MPWFGVHTKTTTLNIVHFVHFTFKIWCESVAMIHNDRDTAIAAIDHCNGAKKTINSSHFLFLPLMLFGWHRTSASALIYRIAFNIFKMVIYIVELSTALTLLHIYNL